MKQYIFKILAISILSLIIGFSLHFAQIKNFNINLYILILVFYNVIYGATHYRLCKQLTSKKFSLTFLSFSVLKLLIFMSLMGTMLFLNRENVLFIAVTILSHYLVFSINDIISIMAKIKGQKQNQGDLKHE